MRSMIGLTPTTQRIEGWPYGECVRASYAAILNLPIEMVPRLDPAAAADEGEDQRTLERRWLSSIGLRLIEIANPAGAIAPSVLGQVPPVVHLMSGMSPRGFGHRCVGLGGKVLFDPHPSRAGLVDVHSIGFLVPL